MSLAAAELNPKQFQKISDMVYRTAGINLKELSYTHSCRSA